MISAFADEFLKLAAVTPEEAAAAYQKLQKLESQTPTAAELGRGALAGSAVGILSTGASNLASGNLKRGVQNALKEKTWGGRLKAMGRSALQAGAGSAAGSATFGAALPLIRRRLDRNAEIAKLKEFVGQEPGEGRISQARHAVAKNLGV